MRDFFGTGKSKRADKTEPTCASCKKPQDQKPTQRCASCNHATGASKGKGFSNGT